MRRGLNSNPREPDKQTIAALFLLLGKAIATLPKQLQKIEINQSDIDEAIRLNGVRRFKIGWKINPKTYDRIWVAHFGVRSKESLGVTPVQIEIDCMKKQRKFDV